METKIRFRIPNMNCLQRLEDFNDKVSDSLVLENLMKSHEKCNLDGACPNFQNILQVRISEFQIFLESFWASFFVFVDFCWKSGLLTKPNQFLSANFKKNILDILLHFWTFRPFLRNLRIWQILDEQDSRFWEFWFWYS